MNAPIRCTAADRCHCPEPVYRGGRCREHWDALCRSPRWKPGELEAAREHDAAVIAECRRELARRRRRPPRLRWGSWVPAMLGGLQLTTQRAVRALGTWVGTGRYATEDAS